MSLRRRKFVQNLLIAPAAPIALAGQQTAPTPQQQPPPQAATPARQMPRQPQQIALLKTTEVDLTSDANPHYFSSSQFQTLTKLGSVLVPPLKGNPGALEAKAPAFLDFLISVSPAERQKCYCEGLDHLEKEAQAKFQKPFGELSAEQAGQIIRPLMTARPWPHDLPEDANKSFLAQVHEDLRTATTNSREWAEAAQKSGHRFTRGARTQGFYWEPIDPIAEG